MCALVSVGDDYHKIAMALRPICEPVELPPGASVLVERVVIEQGSSGIGDFMHFHDLAELVLFRRVSGTFIAAGQKHPVGNGAVVFVPSMQHHDFALTGEAMEWVLVQFDPDILHSLGVGASKLTRPFCIWPGAEPRARIDLLADWLLQSIVGSDPLTERIAELLLLAVAQACKDDPSARLGSSPVERLMPALELLRNAPGEHILLDQAATMCRLSSAYFSRRFRQLFGMTFTDYARTYRLRLAARRLVASSEQISEIAYGVGFSSPAHFTARFRERFGMTPREYRASARMRAAG